jgi:hypothetical protein
MNEIAYVFWSIEVYDHLDTLDVQAASGQVCCNKYVDCVVLETLNHRFSLLLAL